MLPKQTRLIDFYFTFSGKRPEMEERICADVGQDSKARIEVCLPRFE